MKTNFSRNVITGIVIPVLFIAISQNIFAQNVPVTQQMPDTAKMTYNQISQTAKLFVYPSKGQSQQQQKKDEYECYVWAMQQTGIDPLNLPKTQAAQQSGPTGGAIKGAAKGAAAGAAIGAIAGDAGKGAAIGAAAGGMGGLSQGRRGQAQANQQAQANAAAADAEVKNTFIKAFSVCIEGKGYTIK